MAERVKVRVLRGYSVIRDGEFLERTPGEEVEELVVDARAVISSNKAERVDAPKPSLTAAEAKAERDAKAAAADAAERRAQGVETAAASEPESSERTARGAGRGAR